MANQEKATGKIKIGCIGCGVMGGALMKAIHKNFPDIEMVVTDVDKKKAASFAAEIGCSFVESNTEVVRTATHIFLAVKPQFMRTVLNEIAGVFNWSPIPEIMCPSSLQAVGSAVNVPVFISIAAGLTLDTLRTYVRESAAAQPTKGQNEIPPFIRIMPNIPATVNEAMIGLCTGSDVSDEQAELVIKLLSSAGRVERVPESLMDGVTAISGSGPAYAFMFIEALADAAVRCGIPRQQAIVYAAQTLKGSAALVLESGRHPGDLKDAVCSPAGTTIDAVKVLEECGFRSAIMKAADAAWKRSIELGKK